MPRRTAALVGVLAATTLLAGCDKPLPQVTVLAGKSVYRLDAARYCFAANDCRGSGSGVVRIGAVSGSTLLVDVPRAVAGKGWIVAATDLDKDGKPQAVNGAGSVLTNEHTVRVAVPVATSGSYQLSVNSVDGGQWIAQIVVHS